MCVAFQRTQLWMQENLENKIAETKNNKKKLRCQQEISRKQPAEFMRTGIEIRCLFLSAMQGLEYFHQHAPSKKSILFFWI